MASEDERSCCASHVNEWHARPCTVNGPMGLGPSSVGCFSPVPSARHAGAEARRCCETDTRMWHSVDCQLGGPTGPEEVHGGPKRYIVTDNLPPGPIVVGNFTRRDTGIVRALAGLDFGYRTCCSTVPGSPHWQECGTHFFAEGQTVIEPDANWTFGPQRVVSFVPRLRIAEDTGASDRTFENETRPL